MQCVWITVLVAEVTLRLVASSVAVPSATPVIRTHKGERTIDVASFVIAASPVDDL